MTETQVKPAQSKYGIAITSKATPETGGVAGTWEVQVVRTPCPFLISASLAHGSHALRPD